MAEFVIAYFCVSFLFLLPEPKPRIRDVVSSLLWPLMILKVMVDGVYKVIQRGW